MATTSFSCITNLPPCSNPNAPKISGPSFQFNNYISSSTHRKRVTPNATPVRIKCESSKDETPKLEIGSPIVVVEAPKMIKIAASVPCLRVNSSLVNPGDVGRIVSRKPKDVWAVRLSIGTYLIDGKYFKPLELGQ
ncbi:hypothetical protein PanWU01x14_160960 [Parasponia andersonii]|uniref:Chlororespiratory reduction 42 n=1 Tax=Parasponia andersonii TaxID=3476 RepID=A0A2P5CDN3_PARAD|nr:hypothetical protein PanWU01x14_160960 [Parasponia andersonii]